MDVQAIIGELNTSHGLPKAALTAATERREEMVPLFIAEIERYVAAGPDARTRPDGLFFMFHLLGEWRETSAYPALARLLRLPTVEMERILDDAITATTHRVMASVFDGDPQPLYDIILDPYADEFVRSRMCETLAMLVGQGRLARQPVAEFLRQCFDILQPQATCFVWHGWQLSIAMLGLEELTPLVEKAFAREYIDPAVQDFSYFQSDLEQALTAPGGFCWLDGESCSPFGNTIEEFSKWHGFTDAYRLELERQRQAARETVDAFSQWDGYANGDRVLVDGKHMLVFDLPTHTEPVVNPNHNVGRNDPCPCGSGRKFKQCCLN